MEEKNEQEEGLRKDLLTPGGRRIIDFGRPYVPELDYEKNKYKPFGDHNHAFGGFDKHFCERCKDYYCDLKKARITSKEFPPKCEGDIAEKVKYALNLGILDEEDAEAALMLDPITFAASEFNWKPRWYQLEMLRCSSQKKVVRAGRRCLAKDTMVATPKGPTKIQDISPGDIVYDQDGNPVEVVSTYDQGMQKVVDLCNNGRVLATCTTDHVWLTSYRGDPTCRKTDDLYKGVKILRKEICMPLGNVREEHAYVIGALLGDGCSRQPTGVCVSCGDKEVIYKIERILGVKATPPKIGYTWYIPTKLREEIHNYDWVHGKYAHEKTVDMNVLRSWDRESLKEFVAGVLDTDGSIFSTNGEIHIALSMQSRSVVEAIQYALLALWQVQTTILMDDRERYKNGPLWSIRLKHIYHCKRILKDLSNHLSIPRKQYLDKYDDLRPTNFDPSGFGVTIKNARQEHTYDIEVASNDSLYLLANGMVTHNTGKSVAMAVKILHLLYTHERWNILVVCPYQSQIKRIFQIIHNDLLAHAISFNDCITKDKESPPMTIELANGSSVVGFSSGAKSGGKSTQIRGQDAHAIFLDEMDFLSEDDFESILAIFVSHPDCILWASSTPTGARSAFFDYCVDKDGGFKEFHYISPESPSWTAEAEDFMRRRLTEAGYNREILAEFGEETFGVFKNADINKSVQEYTYEECSPIRNARHIIGVDWNETHGVHIVIVQMQGDTQGNVNYKTVLKEVIPKQEFTQITAVQRIIALDKYWNSDFIYVDEGFGSTQVEMLKKYGQRNPHTRIHMKTKSFAMQGKVEIPDPITSEIMKKNAKPFMVNWSVRQVETLRCTFPKLEDTNGSISEEGDSGDQIGLVQQMRVFRVEKFSKFGEPTYSQGYEHTLTAWMLAMVGFCLEFSNIKRIQHDLNAMMTKRLGEKLTETERRNGIDQEAMIEEKRKIKKKLMPQSRDLRRSDLFRIHSTKRAIERDRRITKLDNQARSGSGFIRTPSRLGRKSF